MRMLLLCLFLAGCGGTPLVRCPALVNYSDEFNKGLDSELTAAGDPPHLVQAIGDYIGLRDACKAH